MSARNSQTKLSVYVRWRPPTQSESVDGLIEQQSCAANTGSLLSISVKQNVGNGRPWTSPPAYKAIFRQDDDNATVYSATVAPAIPQVLAGGNCNFFAYGHSGSGKTHTIIGYEFKNERSLGLCLAASRKLFEALESLNQADDELGLGIGFSLFELRKKIAFDLLNGRTECHIRQGSDGKTHIRGQTEVLEGGKVRVRPLSQRACWTFESFREELRHGLGKRAVGSSSVHDQSSRTHAVLRLEIVNRQLMEARDALVDRESELVPVGKRATDVSIEEQTKAVMRSAEGGWIPNPDYRVNQDRIDKAEAEKAEYEARVAAAEEDINAILSSSKTKCLGANMVFVDLAGAEYHQEKGAQAPLAKQTPQERQEGRQINTDLLALKEVIRAWSSNQPRVSFRSSSLTMVLREHFLGGEGGASAMIVTVSPADRQYSATLNSLKYGSLVGVASS
ncbi:P-loop containing nucleoside triphosphate hydrolase protein [Hypoxylon rubiginosum]|uniref:P-loop containing nucleoside triphosphate hydrolase protein n=1 Tax=Hypoxylon rubiginosum TaxID=110542 RepID=A0ACB9ZHX3_9PEZI|nr:P-loop containing nucleoside triphosphate hydrolase protein [Hypoxylon rubiginosum]